ncbi:hypothetical protein EYF80_007138 [Liparis tanakae]|uniref:Uncharacterized protein n=1 Tax=Liparis tanakae TaxID=230148 RepID=A0A4Z2IXB7_9TELE|nr:hypothetical protein EYF80_007138 [Liparis tanakae]
MYLDRPKSPSFTQSGLATKMFLTAMSLSIMHNAERRVKEIESRAAASLPEPGRYTYIFCVNSIVDFPKETCTKDLAENNAAVAVDKVHHVLGHRHRGHVDR